MCFVIEVTFEDNLLGDFIESVSAISGNRKRFENIEKYFGRIFHSQVPQDKFLDLAPQLRFVATRLKKALSDSLVVYHIHIVQSDAEISLNFFIHSIPNFFLPIVTECFNGFD